MKPFHTFLSLIVAVLLSGCASDKYTYGKQTFHSADKALARQAADCSAILEAIQPAGAPVHGKVLVSLPSREELRRHYVRTSGYVTGLRKEHFDYLCAVMDNDQEMLAKAIQRKQLFDELTVTRANDPAAAPIAQNDFLIYRDIDGWFIRSQNSAGKKIEMGAESDSSLLRTQSFVRSVEERARSLAR